MNGNGFSTTDLTALQRQVAAWRRTRRGRSRLPDDLWAAAAALAGAEGVSWVARALHLDYDRLKRRCQERVGNATKPDRPPTFVEVEFGPSLPEPTGRWRIELRDGSARGLAIEIGHDIPALVAVVEAFWSHRP